MAIISVVEFEAKVFQLEQIVIRVRVSMNEQVEDYDYERMANGRTTVATGWKPGLFQSSAIAKCQSLTADINSRMA